MNPSQLVAGMTSSIRSGKPHQSIHKYKILVIYIINKFERSRLFKSWVEKSD